MNNPDIQAYRCLVESHKLLKFYAKLLNMYDGGKRDIPEKLTDWIERVNKTK